MLRKNRLKIFSLLILAIGIILSNSTYAIEITEEKDVEIENNIRIDYTDNMLASKRLMAENVSQSYDLRKDITVRIKNQGSTQGCWTFSTLSVLESHLAKKDIETGNPEIVYNFSERHLNYSTAYADFLNGKTNPWGYNKTVKEGGLPAIALSYITRGSGPINEEDMPFSTNENPIDINELSGKKVQKKINDYIAFPSVTKEKVNGNTVIYKNQNGSKEYSENEAIQVRNSIKKHILTNGAVTAATLFNSTYDIYYNYNAKNSDGLTYPAYYCDNYDLIDNVNHQVTLIGWDDSYSKNNFNEAHRPVHDGAYLVLNSHGNSSKFPEGIYYISYDDIHVEEMVYGILEASNIDYEHIYQHDPLGISTNLVVGQNEAYTANTFIKDSNKTEILKEISISAQHSAKCDIYVSFDNLNTLQPIKKDVYLRQGYTTIKPDEEIYIKSNKFSVVVKYYSENGEDKVYIGVEQPDKNFWSTATSGSGESYLAVESIDEKPQWNDLKLLANTNPILKDTNFCIKAFTEEIEDFGTYLLKNDNVMNISPNTSCKSLKANISSEKEIKVYDKKNQLVDENTNIATGMKITFDDEKFYNLVVKGDLNGDGEVDFLDVVEMQMAFVDLKTLKSPFLEASDVKLDGKLLQPTDLVRLIEYQLKIRYSL